MLEEHKAYKYKVTLTLKRVSAAITFPCKLGIIYKKGKMKLETQSLKDFNSEKMESIINEKFIFESVYIKNLKTNKYLEEFNHVKAFLNTDKGNKNLGILKYNPADFLNEGKNVFFDKKINFLKCPDPEAFLQFDITFLRLGELNEFELKY